MTIPSYQALIDFRRASAATWAAENPILAEGEMGLEFDTNQFKCGDGIHAWLDRPYGGMRGEKGDRGDAFDLTAFYPGKPPTSAIVTRVPLARTVSFPAGLTGSVAKSSAAATAQTDFDIQKNGVSVGTIRFSIGASSATFIAVSALMFVAGDVISIISPSVPDATLANIGFVLTGIR